jgi:hypothetical protein
MGARESRQEGQATGVEVDDYYALLEIAEDATQDDIKVRMSYSSHPMR